MEEEAHKAVYAALTTAPASLTLRDHVPEPDEAEDDSAFPYVVIGEGDTQPHDTDDTVGADVAFNLRIFSRYAGWKQADEIAQTIRDTLHQQTLSVTGFTCWDVQVERADRLRDTETAKTREAVVRVLVRLEE